MHTSRQEFLQWVAGRSAAPLFWISVVHLACIAALIVLWVDVPNLQENAAVALRGKSAPSISLEKSPTREWLETVSLFGLLALWPIVIAESVFHWCTRPWDRQHRRYHVSSFLNCLCPPLRVSARSPEMGHRQWLPGLGWRRSDNRLRRRLERQFSVPMIVIAMMIMPILIIEFFMKAQVAQYVWLRYLLHIGTFVIWFAFAFEFVLMISVAEKKLAYCKKHWVDLAIILLPFISLLRSMRLLKATRLSSMLRIQQITKLARMYRLRATAIKALRALILLEFFHRIFKPKPEKAIQRLSQRLREVELEARQIRRKITRLKLEQQEDQQDLD